eukprot:TRINITY_DN17498_c0_g1_i1.p1 TRINITY_DN17498_c0_g1~~TRINITY_DN17498_c0_g1_i1.p1  ORF type:complete len:584 (+),score=165.09 TRINITY_DN17498_c0_g1_i1:70-1821(+)
MDASVVMLLSNLAPESLMELRGLVRKEPGKRQMFRESGGVELLLARLGNEGNVGIRAELLFTLAFCCDEEGRGYVREAGGLEAAVDILHDAVPLPDSFECCTYAVGLLANYSYPNKIRFHKKGIVEILNTTLTTDTTSRTLLNVTNVLKTLAEECPPVKEAILSTGVLNKLCQLTKQEPQVTTYTMGAIGTIAYKYPEAQNRVLQLGLLRILPSLLMSCTKEHGLLDVSKCLFSCLRDNQAALRDLCMTPSFDMIRKEMHKFLAPSSTDFTTKEIRNGVYHGAAYTHAAYADSVQFCGASVVVRAGWQSRVVCEVAHAYAAGVEIVVHVQDISNRAPVDVPFVVRSSEGVVGAGEGLFVCKDQTARIEYTIETQGMFEEIVATVFVNQCNESCRNGGLTLDCVQKDNTPLSVHVPIAQKSAVPSRNTSEERSESRPEANPDTDLKRQVEELTKKVEAFQAPQQAPPPQVQQATVPATNFEAVIADNFALKEHVLALERESVELRRHHVSQQFLLAQGGTPSPLEPTLTAQAAETGSMKEDVASVTQTLNQLDAECAANELELTRFLKQITQLRERITSASGSN